MPSSIVTWLLKLDVSALSVNTNMFFLRSSRSGSIRLSAVLNPGISFFSFEPAMTDRAAYPACSPPPFLEPVFLRARLSQGMVRSTPSDTPETNRNNPSGGCVMGDLLKIQNEGEHDIDEVHSKTFLIQRKLRDTPFGSIRVCFAVKEVDGSYRVIDAENEKDDEHGVLAVSVASIARIKSDPRHSQSFYTELSALQLVESLRKEQFPLHVQGTRIIATDDLFIYTVVPNHTEGTLFDYCNARGVLSENEARYFFLQILAVRWKLLEDSSDVLTLFAQIIS